MKTHYIYRLLTEPDKKKDNDRKGKIGYTSRIEGRMNQYFYVRNQVEGVNYEILYEFEGTRKEAGEIEYVYQRIFNEVDWHQITNNPMIGKKRPEVSIIMKREQAKWNAARKWYNNGISNKFCIPGEEPDGYVRGRIMKRNDKREFI